MKYLFADYKIEINDENESLADKFKDFKADFQEVDYKIEITSDDVKYESDCVDEECAEVYLKQTVCLRKIGEWLPLHNAFVLHAATFDVDGVGVAFAARSGTGKTTHMYFWKKYLWDEITIVNGDKPIVRFFDDEPETPYAYGTPWNGKEHLGCNMKTPLKHICFIERSETNFVEHIDKSDAIDRILNQVYMPKDPQAVIKTMQLVDRLLACCDLWIIHCNTDPSAAEVSYNAIFK